MPKVYDWNGSAAAELKKIYDWNGSAAAQIKKGYDWNGTAGSLVYDPIITGTIWNNGAGNLGTSGFSNIKETNTTSTDYNVTFNSGGTIQYGRVAGGSSHGACLFSKTRISLEKGQHVKVTLTKNISVGYGTPNATCYTFYIALALLSSNPGTIPFGGTETLANNNPKVYIAKNSWIPIDTKSYTFNATTATLTVGTSGNYYPAILIYGWNSYSNSGIFFNNWIVTE